MSKVMKRIIRVCLALYLIFCTPVWAQQDVEEKRIALVIGVQSYVVMPLKNTLNDAHDMAKALEEKGFEVALLLDPNSKQEMKEAISKHFELITKAKGKVVGLIYYTGHGFVDRGESYLIPAGADVQDRDQLLRIDAMIGNIPDNNLNIIILDAVASVKAPKMGIAICAAQPNQGVSDGLGRNGLFTSKFLQYMKEPNIGLSEIYKKVKKDVWTESNGLQLPTYLDNTLEGDFFFDNAIIVAAKTYSLFIGVDKYQFSTAELPNLNKPVKDATLLRNTLLLHYGFDEGYSVLLSNPKQAEIIRALEGLAKKITIKDNLLIFYAGHGVWDERLKVGYWLPSDSKWDDKSSWISNSTIRDYIAGIQSKHTLLITDACFGGSIFKAREVPAINEYGFSKIYRLSSRQAMTSGTLTTVPDESKFMEYLLKRLSENTNKFLTARQLFSSLETAVLNNTKTVPQFGFIHDTGDEGGEFIFMRK